VLFTIGDKEYCSRTSASMKWRDGKLDFNVFGWGPVVVRRYMDGATVRPPKWTEYANYRKSIKNQSREARTIRFLAISQKLSLVLVKKCW